MIRELKNKEDLAAHADHVLTRGRGLTAHLEATSFVLLLDRDLGAGGILHPVAGRRRRSLGKEAREGQG